MAVDQKRIWMSDDILAYHNRQLAEPYRSTVHLAQFMQRVIPEHRGAALDVACGTGANMIHLNRYFPTYRWIGVDYAGDMLFPLGIEYKEEQQLDIDMELINGDMYALTSLFPRRAFHLVLSMQTLSWLPSYEEALDQLLAMTKGWLVVTSLFSDHDMDAKVEVLDYTREDGVVEPQYYNIYSLPRFSDYCRKRGVQDVISQDFIIDIDLPQTAAGRGTYTRTLQDGTRLQFTGSLHLPWKFVAVKMGAYA
jgi:ubiquinone/menaquinone biosynthesis C-methylase UbiE